jgi:alpha,alpha-trehalase
MDNSASWDLPLASVSPEILPAYDRRDLAAVDASQRPTKGEYDRYLTIVRAIARLGYDTVEAASNAPFQVSDPLTAAILARADADLLWLAHQLSIDDAELVSRAEQSAAALQALWDDDSQCFRGFDLVANRQLESLTIASMAPVWSPSVSSGQVDAIEACLHKWRDSCGSFVPSCDPDAVEFDGDRYWRGPVWTNVAWLVAEGLALHGRAETAEAIRQELASVVAQSGFREYFRASTGEGLGGAQFTWTAALALAWPLVFD